jgi:septal ring factor EnvC (AmiA/AmiB activator)
MIPETGTGKHPAPVAGLFLLCLLVFIAAWPQRSAADTVSDERRAAELRRVQARIQSLQRALAAVKRKREQTRNGLRDIERRIGRLNRNLRKLRRNIRRTRRQLSSLRRKHRRLLKDLDLQRDVLAGQVRASYAMGRQEQLKILLNQGDPARVQRMLVYYEYLIRERSQQIVMINRKLDQLQAVTTAIEKRRQALDKLDRAQREQRSDLQGSRRQRRTLLRKLARDIHHKGRRLKHLRQAEKELQRVLLAIRNSLDDIPSESANRRPFSSRKGVLPWPLRGKIVVRYGTRRRIGNLRWKGVVIRAPRGREVRAISHGRVAFADWLRGYGNLLIIDHGNGYMSLYGHNQTLLKEVGEWVNGGDVIASAGDSGGQNRSGLYFEIRYQGRPVNPKKWCRRLHNNIIAKQ